VDFSGKVVLVTGGSRGIGRACAVAFAKAGATVVLTYAGNDAAAAETVKLAGPKAQSMKFDVADTAACARAIEEVLGQHGRLDVLVNNAGVGVAARLLDTPLADYDQVMNVNDWYLFQGVGNVIGFQRIIAPRLLGLPTDEGAIASTMPRARAVFAELARLLGEQQFFAGDTVSLADLLVAPQIDFLQVTPEWSELGAPHANLVAWLKRMQARPSFVATTWERVSEMAKAA